MGRQGRLKRISWGSVLLAIGGALIFVLALSSCMTVEALLGNANWWSSRATAQATVRPDTPVSPSPMTDWHTYTFPAYGFRLDIPSVLTPQHALLINNGSGETVDWIYQGAAVASLMGRTASETTVRVEYATAMFDTDLCPHGGTAMTIGSGVHAYQETNVPPSPNGPTGATPYVRVSLVVGGVAIRIELDGQGAPATFLARYGPIWEHMLASFTAFPPLQPLSSHPCG